MTDFKLQSKAGIKEKYFVRRNMLLIIVTSCNQFLINKNNSQLFFQFCHSHFKKNIFFNKFSHNCIILSAFLQLKLLMHKVCKFQVWRIVGNISTLRTVQQ